MYLFLKLREKNFEEIYGQNKPDTDSHFTDI